MVLKLKKKEEGLIRFYGLILLYGADGSAFETKRLDPINS